MLISVTEARGKAALRDLRIIKRDLVYIIGLSEYVADEERLRGFDFMGQYGTIRKVVVNRDKPFNRSSREGPSYSAYVTFANEKEAAVAILAVDGYEYDRKAIKASFGMTKYCSFFIKNLSCPNDDCLYLHRMAKDSDCFNKDQGGPNKDLKHTSKSSTIQFLISSDCEFWKVFAYNKFGCQFPSLKTVEKMVSKYCRENGIPYEANEVKKNAKSVKNEKKQGDGSTAHIVHVCKWNNDDTSAISVKSGIEGQGLHGLALTKSISVQQPKRNKAKEPDASTNLHFNKIKKSGQSHRDNHTVGNSVAEHNSGSIQQNHEQSMDSGFINKTSIDNQSKGPKSRKNSEALDIVNRDTAITRSVLNQENNSQDQSGDNILETNIEQVLEQKSEEYSQLDRQIIYRLNSSYTKLAKAEHQPRFPDDTVLVNDDSTEVTKKCDDIKKMISTFLQPNTEILTARGVEHKAEGEGNQFKLFGQAYYIHIPKRDMN